MRILSRKIDWRAGFYSAFIWLLAVLVGGLVVLPWFYLALPVVVAVTTLVYFRLPLTSYKQKFHSSTFFAQGLWLGTLWAVVIFSLDFVEFVNFDPTNFFVYLTDSRNYLKFPVVILIPVIYGLILDARELKISYARFGSQP